MASGQYGSEGCRLVECGLVEGEKNTEKEIGPIQELWEGYSNTCYRAVGLG